MTTTESLDQISYRLPSPVGILLDVTLSGGHILSCLPASSSVLSQDLPITYGDDRFLKRLSDLVALRDRLTVSEVPSHPRFHDLWRVVSRIPIGETRSYKEVTEALNLPRSYVRLVAQALGTNRLCLLVPCHRVVRSDGETGGYRWGVILKERLLDYERSFALRCQ